MADAAGVFTNIDAFVKYLSEHGETEASVIATDLGVTDRNVEEWAKILENSKMAKITYKLGKMYISQISATKETNPEMRQMAEVKKTIVDSEITAQLTDISRLAQTVEGFNRTAAEGQAVLDKNSGQIKDMLGKIAKLQAEADASFNQIKSKKEAVEKFSKELGGTMQNLSGGPVLTELEENRSKAKAIIEDVSSKTKAYEESIANLLKNYDASTREQRNKIIEFSRSARTEIEVLNDLVKQGQKDIRKYEYTYKEYTNENARIKQFVEKNKGEIVDGIAKAQAQIDNIYQLAEGKKKELDAIFSKSNESVAGFMQLSSKLADAKKEIAEAAKENEEIRKEVELLAQQLKAAEAVDKQKVEEKRELMEKVEKASAKTAEKVAKQKEKSKKLKGKLDEIDL